MAAPVVATRGKNHFTISWSTKESDMLVLTRKIGESIHIPSQNLTISVGTIKRGRVRLRISAPVETRVIREEVAQRDQIADREGGHEVSPTSGEKDDN
jgi:carbon storage regulator CsrA